MNDRIFEINDLLHEFVRMDKNYGYLTEEQIYNYLAYDKAGSNTSYELKPVWDTLIKQFDKTKSNTTLNKGLEGWLTLRSKNHADYKKSIKLYINLPYDKLEKASIKIFKFLDKKKINHISKISNNIRNDGLIIRVNDANEAREIINFVNKKIGKDARRTNPFTFREGIVGIGYDGNSSYNKFISFVISEYIKDRKDKNMIDSVSYGDFNSYVIELYKYYFEQNHINEFRSTYIFSDDLKRIKSSDFYFDEKELLLNYENMFKVLIASLYENNNVNDIIGYIIDLQGDNYSKEKMNSYSNISTKENEIDVVQVLNDYIKYAIKEYGFNQAYSQLEAFMYDTVEDVPDKYRFITSKNNFRDSFKQTDMANKIRYVIKDLKEYMRSFIKTDLEELTLLLNEYIDYVGYEQAIKELSEFQVSREYSVLNPKYRERFANVDMANNMRFITENNVELYINEYLKNQKVSINQTK